VTFLTAVIAGLPMPFIFILFLFLFMFYLSFLYSEVLKIKENK
jgi:hypothetical protein